jgi:hopene-associated glycosyltransferase HpnB
MAFAGLGAILALLVWLYLILLHGQFWQSGPSLGALRPAATPPVAIVVPARDEAEVIVATLRSLLAQDYAGTFQVVLVDDGSTDGTGGMARAMNMPRVPIPRLRVVDGTPPPAGWSGKLWAVAQGVAAAPDTTALLLLTDADIIHDPRHLSALVARIELGNLDMVSEMVALACDSWAERALVPAFVYFFQLLYPFGWVNDPLHATAAAAGGTILLRRRALERIGGIAAMRGALIDDVALAAAVKRGGRVWLGHSELARSVRPYPGFADIWRMVARTAYVQLGFSPLLLVATTLGLALVFLVPPLAAVFGHGLTRLAGLLAWGGMAWSYLPTLRRFGRSAAWAVALPAVAAFYMAATIGSAVDHHRGRGVRWKQRAYSGP